MTWMLVKGYVWPMLKHKLSLGCWICWRHIFLAKSWSKRLFLTKFDSTLKRFRICDLLNHRATLSDTSLLISRVTWRRIAQLIRDCYFQKRVSSLLKSRFRLNDDMNWSIWNLIWSKNLTQQIFKYWQTSHLN
jgi:hypothetical protein